MFDTLFEDVVRAINKWRPKKKYSREPQYRDDLLDFLREELNESHPFGLFSRRVSIIPEHGRGLCDIAVDRKVGIELKKDLKTKSQVDRLFGQINLYRKEYEDIIVVLVGETNKNALEMLKDHISDLSEVSGVGVLGCQRIEIIDKGSKTRGSKSSSKSSTKKSGTKKKGKVSTSKRGSSKSGKSTKSTKRTSRRKKEGLFDIELPEIELPEINISDPFGSSRRRKKRKGDWWGF